jgi:hypothetical protein
MEAHALFIIMEPAAVCMVYGSFASYSSNLLNTVRNTLRTVLVWYLVNYLTIIEVPCDHYYPQYAAARVCTIPVTVNAFQASAVQI